MAKRDEQPLPLLVYADELVDTLRSMVPDAIRNGDEKAVHQARVACRRLKSAVDVFKPISSGSHRREFARILKKLRKNLGPMRDTDVMLGHLKDLETPKRKAAIDWLRARLAEKQKQSRESALDEIDVAKILARLGSWWGVREEWSDVGDKLTNLLAESLHLQLDRFIEHADAIAGKPGATGALLDPHELRIAGKALRYTLELAAACGHRLPGTIARSFKRMQDALGLWHDYIVLNDQLLKWVVGNRDSGVVLAALDLAKTATQRSQKQLSGFSKLWIERGESLAGSIRKAFPLTQPVEPEPVTEPQTDPDPSDSAAFQEASAEPATGEPSAA
jgi:CHAD domain-containing protein